MSRAHRLALLLRQLHGVGAVAPELYVDPAATGDTSFDLSLAGFAAVWACQFEQARHHAAAARRAATDAEAAAMAVAVGALADAGLVDGRLDEIFVGPDQLPTTGELHLPVVALLLEAALAHARLDLAARLAALLPPITDICGDSTHPFLTFIRCSVARVHLFSGDVNPASDLVAQAVAGAQGTAGALFAAATCAAVDGAAGRRPAARAAVRRILASSAQPHNVLMSGVYLLASYAAAVGDDVTLAATAVLRASADADLSELRVIDRAFCFEILTRAAVDSGDLDAAEAWQLRAMVLAGHPIADSSVHRIASRVSLLAGDPRRALDEALAAVAAAARVGRAFEVAEGEILCARARIAMRERGGAAHRLAHVVAGAEASGFGAVRLSAARELRAVGRRLPPQAHRGWEALSARERQIAVHIAEGRSNADIAAVEFLSEHTVRCHVSRVLHAFGVPTRVGVASALSSSIEPGEGVLAALTPRQQEVVDLLAAGATNRVIAATLRVSESTVEKHVSAVMQRWNLTSRAGIAREAARSRAGSSAFQT